MEVCSFGPEGIEKIEKNNFQENKAQSNSLLEMMQNIQETKIFNGEVNVDSSLNPDAPEFIPLQGPEVYKSFLK